MNQNDIIIADAFVDAMLAKLDAAGIGLLRGPYMRRPRWWELARRRDDNDLMARLNSVGLHLTPEARIRYRAECAEGQGYDDATGFWARCWCAAFCLPFKPAWISASALPRPSHDGRG